MGTAAVSGQSANQGGDTQRTSNQKRRSGVNNYSNNHTQSGGDSSPAAPTTSYPTREPPQPTDRSKVKNGTMSCEMCSVNFTLFKRKKCCQECRRYFCSNCLPKPPSNSPVGRQCSKCRLIMSGRFSRDDLKNWKVKDMRCFLQVRNISTKDCREKHDLIDLVVDKFCVDAGQSTEQQSEHEHLVRQMADHMRIVSDVSSAGSSITNSPATPRTILASTSQGETSSAPTTSSSSQATTTQAASISSTQSQTATDSTTTASSGLQNDTGANNSSNQNSNTEPSGSADRQNEESEAEREEDRITAERLRELLESMERIQEVLIQHESREEQEEENVEPPIRRMQLDDVSNVSDIDDLTIRQLKELLVNNFVDYRGCCEKAELVEKTKRLWKDHQENRRRAERIHKAEETEYHERKAQEKASTSSSEPKTQEEAQEAESQEAEPQASTTAQDEAAKDNDESSQVPTEPATSIPDEAATTTTADDSAPPSSSLPAALTTAASSSEDSQQLQDSLCHICMDSLVDCILLECGHMVTCTQCGKRLADCPICRQYISRVVRVFRA